MNWLRLFIVKTVSSWLSCPTVTFRFKATGSKESKTKAPTLAREVKLTYFTEDEVKGLEKNFVEKLEKAREISGVPFIITSGKRMPDQNSTVGGVQDSAHLRGRAVDLRSRDSHTHFKIIEGAIKAGINRIGYYTGFDGGPTHIHLDDDTSLPQEVMWHGLSH